jgi:hypothetical protein
MSNYTPGEGYDKGFQCRMNGGTKPSQALGSSDPYWQEYSTGWNDADTKIINEARERNECTKPKCCKNKNFIQD